MRRKPWRKRVGGHGHTVIVGERDVGGLLYLFIPRTGGGYDMQSLGHTNRERGEERAKKLAGSLLAARRALKEGLRPLNVIFAKYEQDVSKFKKGHQPAEDQRRALLWLTHLGARKDARKITRNDMRRFVRCRRAGEIVLPPVEQPDGSLVERRPLKVKPSGSTIGADIVFLQSVLNWAVDERLLRVNPVAQFDRPRSTTPKQPVASFDRFLTVYRRTAGVGALGLFREFFLLIGNELDWRVSALCQVRVSDVDLTPRPEAPHGRVRRDEEADKEGAGGWVPLTFRARRAFQRALRKRGAVGNVYLFESPKRAGKPWSRWHARDLLERAEQLAGVEQLDGGDFHPYRRKWSTERKHHPWADIAEVSGRKDRRTFERSYAKPDADSTLAVVMDARRLRGSGDGQNLRQNLRHGGQEVKNPATRKSDRAVG